MFRLYALLLTTLLAPGALAQTSTLTGRVVDGDFPMPTASVAVWQIAGTDSTLVGGATTNIDGVFRIESLPTGTYDVVASFVGYEPGRL